MANKVYFFIDLDDGKEYVGAIDGLVCTLNNPDPDFAVASGSIVPIPFQSVIVNPNLSGELTGIATIADGVVTPLIAGWYDVYGMIFDSYPNGSYRYNLHILGNGSIGIVDDHLGVPSFKLAGRQLVYCNGVDDTIALGISHSAGIELTFNHLVGYEHRSYITIHYAGQKASGIVQPEE